MPQKKKIFKKKKVDLASGKRKILLYFASWSDVVRANFTNLTQMLWSLRLLNSVTLSNSPVTAAAYRTLCIYTRGFAWRSAESGITAMFVENVLGLENYSCSLAQKSTDLQCVCFHLAGLWVIKLTAHLNPAPCVHAPVFLTRCILKQPCAAANGS